MSVSTDEKDQTKINRAIQQVEQGRLNASGTFTLAASTTTTVVTSTNCGASSQVIFSPKTANAATALATTYVSSVGNGTFTVTHASNSQVDRTFGFVAIG